MNKKPNSRFPRFFQLLTTGVMTAFAISACAVNSPALETTSPVETVVVTQVVTRVVTEQVTRMVTVPVTVTPEPIAAVTDTPPSTASASDLSLVTMLHYTDCLYGPASFFLYKTSLPDGQVMQVTGRNPDGTWLEVEEVNGWNPCWIPVTQTQLNGTDFSSLPVVYPQLPISYWNKPPNPQAKRQGSTVTVTWDAVPMAQFDYRGYLILAWVCQNGEFIWLPVNLDIPYAGNTGKLSTTITDEPGCPQKSSAWIYTAEKRGYFGQMVFWPSN